MWKIIKDRLFGSNDIYDSLSPILTFGYFMGLTPFRIFYTPSRKYLGVTYLGLVPAVFHFVIYAGGYFYSVQSGENIVEQFVPTQVSKIGDFMQSGGLILGLAIIYVTSFFYRQSFVTSINMLAAVDKKFEGLGVWYNFRWMIRSSYVLISIAVPLCAGFLFQSYFLLKQAEISPSIPIYFTYFLPHCCLSVAVLILVSGARTLFFRFKILNEVLLNIFHDVTNKAKGNKLSMQPAFVQRIGNLCALTPVAKSLEDKILDITKINDLLTQICRHMNDYFAYHLLTIVSIIFLTSLFNCYYLLDVLVLFRRSSFTANGTFIMFLSAQVLFYLFELFSIIESGSQIINESQRTATYIHRLINTVQNEKVRTSLSYLSLQLLHRELHFSAAGFFNIDRALCLTMIGTCTTYLIILLQFASNDNKNSVRKDLTDSGT